MMDGQHEVSGKQAMVRFKNQLWIAQRGEGADSRVFVSFFSGSTWSTGMPVPGVSTGSPPALAATSAELYLLWWGEGDASIHWSKSSDGQTWNMQRPLPGEDESGTACDTGPANEKPHLVWTTDRPIESTQRRTKTLLRPFLLSRMK